MASGRIVARNGPGAAQWELRELHRMGSADVAGPELFGSVLDLAMDQDGRLYVLDGQASEVRLFGPEGEHVRSFGSPGRGPGELATPAGIALAPDGAVWVLNMGNARYTAFDPGTGEVVAEPRRQARFGLLPWPGVFDREGRLTDVTVLDQGTIGLVRLDSAFAFSDTVPAPGGDPAHEISFWRGDLRAAAVRDPFAPNPAFAFAPSGGVVLGEGSAYRIHRVTFASDTTLTIEVDREPVPVTSAERDSALAAFEDFTADANAEPERRPRVLDFKPAHGALFVDDQDRIWVRRAQARDDPVAWDVLAPDGRLAGFVVVPPIDGQSFVLPVVAGGRMAMTAAPGGVPTVIVYEVLEATR